MTQLPLLYSFRRCPYAMRARLGLYYAGINCEIREVVLRDKPLEMLKISPKETVPVLQLPDGTVLDESYDIIQWALNQNDPDGWLNHMSLAQSLKNANDHLFTKIIQKYKYAIRYPERPPEFYRDMALPFLKKLNHMLSQQDFLAGHKLSVADIVILPFIRQFAHVDREWFFNTTYTDLQNWLHRLLDSELFGNIMKKYPQWHDGNKITLFP